MGLFDGNARLGAGSSLIPGQGTPGRTMSTREIADLCDARHNDVIATTGRLFDKGVLRESRKTLRAFSPPGGGRPTMVYDLTQRDTYVVVSGYSDEVRARIIDRWMELDGLTKPVAAPAPPVAINVRDHGQLAAVALQLIEFNKELEARAVEAEAQVAELEPKALAHDRIADLSGTFCRTTAAKILGISPKILIDWLRENKWTYERAGDDVAMETKARAGLLVNKVEKGKNRRGMDWARTYVHVTPKGLTALAKEFPPLLQLVRRSDAA